MLIHLKDAMKNIKEKPSNDLKFLLKKLFFGYYVILLVGCICFAILYGIMFFI